MLRQDFPRVPFEQIPETGERTSHVIPGEKTVTNRRNSKCEGPEMGLYLKSLRKSKEVSETANKRDMR